MIHIAGGIILAVLGLRAIGLFAYSFRTPSGQLFWMIAGLVVFFFGVSLFRYGSPEGGLVPIALLAALIGWKLYGTQHDNSTVDWKPRKDLGRRIR